MKLIASLFLLSLLCLTSWAQVSKGKFAVDLQSGTQAGWWIFNQGSDDPKISNNQGWDRTHLANIWHEELNLRYRLGRLQLGAGVAFLDLRDRIMVDSEDQSWSRDRYAIADVSLKGIFYSAIVGWELVSNPRYSFVPELKTGTFYLDQISPEKPWMKGNFHWEAGLSNEFRLGRLGLLLKPVYTSGTTFHKKPGFYHQRSTLVGFGITGGIRFWIGK
ncbi:MAG: hypothetical protein H6581_27280 [Bacteroidia bacterium]|nr:hypothetical protein [Bacteroidia bacterium]